MSAATNPLASVLPNLLATALRPTRFMASLVAAAARAGEAQATPAAGRSGPSAGRWPVLLVAICWAAFCLLLYRDGHAPSVVLLPLSRAHYYLFQAVVLVPLLQLLWWLLTRLACRLGRVAAAQREALAIALAYAYAAPLLLAFLLPDVVVYLSLGHAKMGRALLFYAPIAPLWTLALGSLALRKIAGCSVPRSWLAMLAALLCQAFVGSLLLR